MTKQRNYSIDFWKMVFAIMIVICHSTTLQSFLGVQAIAPISYLGVEFFFIVGGFLMVKSANKNEKLALLSTVGLGRETFDFLINKIKSFLPYYVFALIVNAIIQLSTRTVEVTITEPRIIGWIWDVLQLRIVGFRGHDMSVSAVGGGWYLSAMIIAMSILYPILRGKKELFINLIAPILAAFCLGYICYNYGKLNVALNWRDNMFFSMGLLRAVGEICLGCWCYALCERIKKVNFTTISKILLTILEFGSFIAVIAMMFVCQNGYYVFLIPLILIIGITLAFSDITYSKCVFRGELCKHFGTISLCLYLNHYNWLNMLSNIYAPLTMQQELLIYFALAITSSFICMFVVGGLKIFAKKILRKIKNVFIIPPIEL